MLLRHAEVFRDVATLRSFSQAAKVRGVSQPAVSHSIQQLEDYFGVQLFDRSTRPLELTPAGRTYLEGCCPLLDGFRALEDHVRSATGRLTGTVKVEAIYSTGLMEMSSLADRFEEDYPEAHIDLRYAHPDVVTARVEAGECDLGITSFPELATRLEHIPWKSQVMAAFVPSGHEWATEVRSGQRTGVSLTEMAGRPFVGLTPDLATRRQIDAALRDAGGEARVVRQFDNIDTVLRAVGEGAGITIVPSQTGRQAVESGEVVEIPIDGSPLKRSLGIVMKKGARLAPAARAFVDRLTGGPPVAETHDATLEPVATFEPATSKRGRLKRPAGAAPGDPPSPHPAETLA